MSSNMNFLFFVLSILCINEHKNGDCTPLQTPETMKESEDKMTREESLLATGVSDKTRNRNSYDQSKPKYLDVISEDYGRALDNLVESQDGSLDQTVKEKRCRILDNSLVGLQRNSNVNLPLIRRETTTSIFKKTCDNCMSGPMCKTKGKCDSCKKICERYEASIDQQSQDKQMDESVTIQNAHGEEAVGISSRLSNSDENQGGLSDGDDRYYTVGSFGPGAVHKLLTKLLNIKDSNYLEQLVVLAKTKSRKDAKSIHPVVIDTAHVFTLNKGGPSKLDVELHKVSDSTTNAEAIATELDKEIENAMEEKRRKSTTPYLTREEIDDIIFNAMEDNSKSKNGQDSKNMSKDGLGQEKNETVACKDKDDEEDQEEVFIPYRPLMRENEAEMEKPHSQDSSGMKPISEDINKDVTKLANRLKTSGSRESMSEEKKLIEPSANHPKLLQTTIPESMTVYPHHELQTDIAKPNTSRAKFSGDSTELIIDQQATKTHHKNLEQENLQGITTPASFIMATRHSSTHLGHEAADANEGRSLNFHEPSPQNRPSIALQPQYEGEQYASIYSYPSANSKILKQTQEMEDIVEPNRSKMSQSIIGQQAPLHPDSVIRTTTEEPTHMGPKAPFAADKMQQYKKNDKDKPSQEHLQGTTTPADIILTTRHSSWPHGPKPNNTNKGRSSLNLHQSLAQTQPSISLQPHYEDIYAQINSDPPTYSKNLKQIKSEEAKSDDENPSTSVELDGIIEPNQRKMTDDNSQFIIGQQAPLHPDSAIRTTTEDPTYLRPKAPFAADKMQQYKSEKKKPSQELLQGTTTPADLIMTTRHSSWPHGPKPSDSNQGRSSSLNLHQSPSQAQPGTSLPSHYEEDIYPLTHSKKMKPTARKEINGENERMRSEDSMKEIDDPISGFVQEKVSESGREKEMYEEKYNKLKQWVMENVGAHPPISDSRESDKNNLSDEIRGIVDSATRINDKISNIVNNNSHDPNLLEMVRDNDQKLKNLDDHKKMYSIRLPNINEFKTRLAPENERKINEIFENPRPMTRQRTSNDPYDIHPRRISQYKNGEWTYEKSKPNKPPYPIKNETPDAIKYEPYKEHSVGVPQPNQDSVPFVDSQLIDMDSMVKSLKEMQDMPNAKANKVVSIIEPENYENALNTARNNAEKKLEEKINHNDGGIAIHRDSNTDNPMKTMQDIPETLTRNMEENNETVACSKEEEEEVNHILHFLPVSHIGRSSGHQESNQHTHHNNHHVLDNKSKSLDDKPDNEYQARSSTKTTTDMIESLNKMHRHGKLPHSEQARDFQDMNDEDQRSFIQPMNGPPMEIEQYSYFPQEQNRRYPINPMFSDAMRMNQDHPSDQIDPNFMEQPQIIFNKENIMDQNLIGSPLMEDKIKKSLQQHSTHLGKFIPRHSDHIISLHTRDVSGQDKHKNMFFVGDGIRLPLNMKEHNDGSLHLSVDIKALCDCKHCIAKQLKNNTIILEALPLSEKEKLEIQDADNETTEKIQEDNTNISQNEAESKEFGISSEETDNAKNQKDKSRRQEQDNSHISKRSLQDNEVNEDFSNIDEEIPLRSLSRQEIVSRLTKIDDPANKSQNRYETSETTTANYKKGEDSERYVNYKTKIFGSVIDFLRNIAMDTEY